jgi:arabinose-5-phosphate isomerase
VVSDRFDFIKIAQDVLVTEANELLNASKLIDDSIAKAVEIISSSSGKLIVTGVGKSGLVGSKIAATLASTGTSSFFLHPTEALHGDLGMIGKDDVVLAISYSGESEELVKILPHIKRFDIPLIAMTRDINSSLAKYATVTLLTIVQKEACPLNTAPTSSTTLTMSLGDALAVCLMKKANFQKEDFASFHPGGSLGKKLFVKIKDLMKTDDLPLVKDNIILKDALVTMSQGRLGNLLIVNDKNQLVAILSDGDLRRALMNKNFTIEDKAINFATKNPKTLNNENLLASDALRFLEEYKIQLAVITNNQNQIQGVLHLHDLVEAGIK